jgi:hypothetical protein
MIHNDQELRATQARMTYFVGLVAQLRVTTSPTEFELMASGYLAEIDKMHTAVMGYLRRHARAPASAEVA